MPHEVDGLLRPMSSTQDAAFVILLEEERLQLLRTCCIPSRVFSKMRSRENARGGYGRVSPGDHERMQRSYTQIMAFQAECSKVLTRLLQQVIQSSIEK